MSIYDRDWYREEYHRKERVYGEDFSKPKNNLSIKKHPSHTLWNLLLLVLCPIAAYESCSIAIGRMGGNPWPPFLAMLLCWVLFGRLRCRREHGDKGFFSGLTLAVCLLSAIAATIVTALLSAVIFMDAYVTEPVQEVRPVVNWTFVPSLSAETWIIIFFVAAIAIPIYREKKRKDKVRNLVNGAIVMTPEEFMRVRNASASLDCPGVYLLYNESKDKYYVGQSKRVLTRINQHFTGHGNGDLYADYKYQDRFIIRIIRFEGSGFHSLNELEKSAINTYHAYSRGYNKTRGNRG